MCTHAFLVKVEFGNLKMDGDSLCWIGKNRMVCEKERCVKEYDSLVKMMECDETLKLVNTMTRSEYAAAQRTRDVKFDWDFFPFHCACHDVSLGKTSFPCDKCGMWICQSCATKTYTENLFKTLCPTCFSQKMPKKIKKRYERGRELLRSKLEDKRVKGE
jgi:hypothetical protein